MNIINNVAANVGYWFGLGAAEPDKHDGPLDAQGIAHGDAVNEELLARDDELGDGALRFTGDSGEIDESGDVFYDLEDSDVFSDFEGGGVADADGDIFYDLEDSDDEWDGVTDGSGTQQTAIRPPETEVASRQEGVEGLPDDAHSVPVASEKPVVQQYGIKEQRAFHSELLALRADVQQEVRQADVPLPGALGALGKASGTDAGKILNGIRFFEKATPSEVLISGKTSPRAEFLRTEIGRLTADINRINTEIQRRQGKAGENSGAILEEGEPPDAGMQASVNSFRENVAGALHATKTTLTHLTGAAAGTVASGLLGSLFGGLVELTGTLGSAAYAVHTLGKIPDEFEKGKLDSFLSGRLETLESKFKELIHLEAELGLQERNVDRIEISIHERKIQKNALILEANRLSFELGMRALNGDSSVDSEKLLLASLKAENVSAHPGLAGLIAKQERVVELSTILANQLRTPQGDAQKHDVSIGDGQKSKSIRDTAAKNVPLFTSFLSTIWQGITKVASSIAKFMNFWSDISASREARSIENSYSDNEGKAVLKLLSSDPKGAASIKLAVENLNYTRSDAQNTSLIIGMKLSDLLAAQPNSGAGSLIITDPGTGDRYPIVPNVMMTRHLVNYLTDLADEQITDGAFNVTGGADGASFTVQDSSRKLYSFLSCAPTVYTNSMAAKAEGGRAAPGVAYLNIDDPNKGFPGGASSMQFNMELDANGNETLRIRFHRDKHTPVFAPLLNESETRKSTLQDIPNIERLLGSKKTDFSKSSTAELEARQTAVYQEIQSMDKLIEGDIRQIGALKEQQNPYFLARKAS